MRRHGLPVLHQSVLDAALLRASLARLRASRETFDRSTAALERATLLRAFLSAWRLRCRVRTTPLCRIGNANSLYVEAASSDAQQAAEEMQIPPEECRREIEQQFGCGATYAYTSPVRDMCGDLLIDVKVHVFKLTGHPEATEAYACPPGPMGNAQRGLVIVLRKGVIDGPVAAVRSVLGLALTGQTNSADR